MTSRRPIVLLSALVTACSSPPLVRNDAIARCIEAEQCADGLFCNGDERCEPGDPTSDPMGCAPAASPPCAAGDTCNEDADRCGCETPDADGDEEPSITCGGQDCDDTDAARSPAFAELCDAGGLDEDCDPSTFGLRDLDADGAIDAACCNGVGTSDQACGDDCDDRRAAIRPGATELCNEIDDDCDASVDEGVRRAFHRDADGDGHGDPAAATVSACFAPSGRVEDATDCDDANPARRPSAPEICDAIDNDCDSGIDEGVSGGSVFPDCDGDLHGTPDSMAVICPSTAPTTCTGTRAGWSGIDDDCDDGESAIHPGAIDACDGLDGDCDGSIDDRAESDAWCSDPVRRALRTSAALCTAGACVPSACESGFLDCDDALGCEVEAMTDPSACGACDRVCAWGACRNARCEPSQLALSDGYGGCALRGATVYCWGDFATHGEGGRTDRSAPRLPIGGVPSAAEIAMGGRFGCARTAAGAVSCWGAVPAGTCGGLCVTAIDMGASGAIEIAAARSAMGAPTICWRTASGTIACADGARWDLGGAIVEILAAEARTTGARIACGRLEDGTVRCGARRASGGDTLILDVPGLDDAVSIDAYGVRACAARQSGEVVCWLLEDPWSGPIWTLVPVIGATGAVEVATGNAHACLRRADGTIACWGANAHGQCGDGTVSAARDRPVEVVGIDDALSIVAGNAASCALRATGPVCWGDASRGALGNGSSSGDAPIPSSVLAPP